MTIILNFQKPISTGLDQPQYFMIKDENGFYENIAHYDFSGNLVGISKDFDSDGSYDYYEMILEDGDTLKFIDENRNGAMERAN